MQGRWIVLIVVFSLISCLDIRSSDSTDPTISTQQEAFLKAPNVDAGDLFGGRVAISGDTIVIGAIHEDSIQNTINNESTASNDDTLPNSGAVYVFRRTGSNWAQEAYIKPPNPLTTNIFGTSVAISGDTIVVGTPNEDGNQNTITNGATIVAGNNATESGAAYVFKRSGTDWAQEAYIKPPFNQNSDFFGTSVAISGDTIVVGAVGEDSNQAFISNSGDTLTHINGFESVGAAFVFKRTGTDWAFDAFIKPPNPDVNDQFGGSVAISGDTIVVGATGEDSNLQSISNGETASGNNSALNSGAAYVFKRDVVTGWAQEAYLKAPNAEASDNFGGRVAISEDTIVVGAKFEDSKQTLITNDPTTEGKDNLATDAGAVYVFKRSGFNWAREAYIKAPNAESGDLFGTSVAISGDVIVVGANGEASNQTTITNGDTASRNNSASGTGAAYIFKRTGTTWAQEAYIKAPKNDAEDNFGIGVAVSDDTIVVGADGEDSNQFTITNGTTASGNNELLSSGAAYVFRN